LLAALSGPVTWGLLVVAGGIRGRRERLSLPFANKRVALVIGTVAAGAAVVIAHKGKPGPLDFYWPVIGVFLVRALIAPAPKRSAERVIRVLRIWDRRSVMPPARRAALTTGVVCIAVLPFVAALAGQAWWPENPYAATKPARAYPFLAAVWNFRLALGKQDYNWVCEKAVVSWWHKNAPCRDLAQIASVVERGDALSQNSRDVFGTDGTLDTFRVQEIPAPRGVRIWNLLPPHGDTPVGSTYVQGPSGTHVVVMLKRHPTTDRSRDPRSLWLYDVSLDGRYWRISGFRACSVGAAGTGKQPARCTITDDAPATEVRQVLRHARQKH
jgi:hypothetical protein